MPTPIQLVAGYRYLIQRTQGMSTHTVALIDRQSGEVRARISADLAQPGSLRTAMTRVALKATETAKKGARHGLER